MKLGLFLVGLFAWLLPLRAESLAAGVAATVNGEVIRTMDVDRRVEPWLSAYFSDLHGADLTAKRTEREKEELRAMIDRALIIQAFYLEGGKVPDALIDGRVDDIVKNEYGSDYGAFERTLRERGITLKKYREEIADNYIVGTLRASYTSNDWFISFRKKAEIKIYSP
jgi:hypothetical protein